MNCKRCGRLITKSYDGYGSECFHYVFNESPAEAIYHVALAYTKGDKSLVGTLPYAYQVGMNNKNLKDAKIYAAMNIDLSYKNDVAYWLFVLASNQAGRMGSTNYLAEIQKYCENLS